MSNTPSLTERLIRNIFAGFLDLFRIGNGPLSGFTLLRKYFSPKDLREITGAVANSEKTHRGELKVAVETKIPLFQIFSGKTARDRALEMFSFLKVWDTEENTGILIYILLSEKKIVTLADRGIYKKIGQEKLNLISTKIGEGFRHGAPKDAILTGIKELTEELSKHFPARKKNPNEISNEPYIS
ncbi:TPM domain-containing protein [Leptospira sp. SA-E8]|uniref:TPM domain-containing protein n=1 Tax=Leptospira sp. SA-E8 TaxID=3422259 RepID=UPI003EB83DC2